MATTPNCTTPIDLDNLITAVDQARKDAAGTPWASRIEDAYNWLVQQTTVESTPAGQLVVTSPSGNTYYPNGGCGCQAGQKGIPCWHRAARQLTARMLQLQENELLLFAKRWDADVTSRQAELERYAAAWDASAAQQQARHIADVAAQRRAQIYAEIEECF